MSEKDVVELRRLYPEGTRIILEHMEDDCMPVPDGAVGIVDFVDDAGTIHMKWSNGSSLGLIAGIDSFRKI